MMKSQPDQQRIRYTGWHVVQIVNPEFELSNHMWDWLHENVGSRGSSWEYVTSQTLSFQQPDHAIKFALTFT